MLETQQTEIRTREDLIEFVRMLRADFVQNGAEWENNTIDRYLEAFQAVLSDWNGRFSNRQEPVPEAPSWRLIGEILLAATTYE